MSSSNSRNNYQHNYNHKHPTIKKGRKRGAVVVSLSILAAAVILGLYYQCLILPAQAASAIDKLNVDGSSTLVKLGEVKIDKVVVDKSARIMQLMSKDKVIRVYHIALGDNPKGHKRQEGDERTPEGVYTLDYKNENSIAYRSIHISYPNEQDIAQAKASGVSPGGDIMIHGQMNGYEKFTQFNQQRDWTDGCIAVTNDEMDEIMAAIEIGTPIEIVW
ncbi:MAG: L,D-transpeptidase family protein [Psychrobacter sp.]|nr:L,D-transpeptidase family protein [Psychrobacter sp.]